MPARSLTLVRNATSTITQDGMTGYRFTVTAQAGSNIANEIFLYLRLPSDPADSNSATTDVFQGVCSPADLAEAPINNPGVSDEPAWCRKTSLDLLFRSSEEAQSVWDDIKADVQSLLNALKRLDTLSSQETTTLTG